MTKLAADKEAQPTGDGTTRSRSKVGTAFKTILGLAGLAALVWMGRSLGGYLPRFAEWVDGLGFWGPLDGGLCLLFPA